MGEHNLEGYLADVIWGSITITAAFVLARTNILERYNMHYLPIFMLGYGMAEITHIYELIKEGRYRIKREQNFSQELSQNPSEHQNS